MPELLNTALRQNYGAIETNTLADTDISHSDTSHGEAVDWVSPTLDCILRIRMVTDPGCPFFDVSYVLGRTKDGQQVRVRVPFYQLDRRTWMSDMYDAATRDGVRLNALCGGHVRDVVSRCY